MTDNKKPADKKEKKDVPLAQEQLVSLLSRLMSSRIERRRSSFERQARVVRRKTRRLSSWH